MTITPNNPIKTVEELSKLSGEEIYLVSQSGHQTTFKFEGISSFNAIHKFGEKDLDHWGWAMESYIGYPVTSLYEGHRVHGSLGDVNIGSSNNKHHLFAKEADADDYANQMKNDPDYIQGVLDHHARCAELDQYY